MPSYRVSTDIFEGPLELLLTLIEKRKLLINDISLAAVTDDFIAHVNTGEHVPLSERAHFVLVASTLLLIKSKSLLPTLELSEEEAASVEDLERRLKLYQRFRELSRHVHERYGERVLYTPAAGRPVEPLFSPSRDITSGSMLASIRSVLQALPKKEFVPRTVVEQVISLEEMIERLTSRIAKGITLRFNDFAGMGAEEKGNIIVSFLAMLELVKQGSVAVTQDAHFSDITMESDAVSIPRYG